MDRIDHRIDLLYVIKDAYPKEALLQINPGTAHTTVKITPQHGLIYQKLIRSIGTEGADQYYRANAEVVERQKKPCKKLGVPMEEKGNFVCSFSSQNLAEVTALESLSTPAVVMYRQVWRQLAGAAGGASKHYPNGTETAHWLPKIP